MKCANFSDKISAFLVRRQILPVSLGDFPLEALVSFPPKAQLLLWPREGGNSMASKLDLDEDAT